LNAAGNALAVAGAKEQGLQNEQVQGALQQGDAIVFFLMGRHTTRVSRSSGRMSTRLLLKEGTFLQATESISGSLLRRRRRRGPALRVLGLDPLGECDT
jgi:hypothetical protein